MAARRRTIVVLSPKGGTGKTTVATNLAVGLARRHPDQAVLVDLDVAFGDVAPALRIDARYGLLDVAGGRAPVRHVTGLHVVPAPDTPEPLDVLADEAVTAALETVCHRYAIAVLDTGAGFDQATRSAAMIATDLVLVASLDVPSLLALRKAMRWLDRLGQTTATRHVVVNRVGASSGVDHEDVRAALGCDAAVEIPEDLAIAAAVTDGIPVTQGEARRGVAAAAFERLVDTLSMPVATDRRWWRRS